MKKTPFFAEKHKKNQKNRIFFAKYLHRIKTRIIFALAKRQ